MLNYANLNDVEFEALCRDIMSRKLGVELRRFASGRDGGVDLTDNTLTHNIVVQVKHYQNSDTAALLRSLKKELPKVRSLAPGAYYICCSRELSPGNLAELRQHFGTALPSDDHIVTLSVIDDFLKDEENLDILKKHYKLWLDSTGILERIFNDEIFVDCEALVADIEESCRLFVPTAAFYQALECLEQNRTLCVIGNPGVGKTITTKMLVMHYAALGYQVRYTSDVTDLSGLKASLRSDPKTPEIILLDDCFGQAYFEMKYTQGKELLDLIKYVKLHKAKVLILNSRVTIFQEARETQPELVRSLERGEYRIYIIDMSRISQYEKAGILYNHLVYSDIPPAYFDQIRMDQRYRRLIEHPNYNPRIIEFACSPHRYRSVSPDQFFDLIYQHLENPQDIWKDEYERKLRAPDRILLQTIYSLTDTLVKTELVRQCFERRIAQMDQIDKTINQWEASLRRLTDGFVTIIDRYQSQYISMVNPSVNDFLDNRMKTCPSEKEELVKHIYAEEQIKRLLPLEEARAFTARLLRTGAVDKLVFPSTARRDRFIAFALVDFRWRAEDYRETLERYLEYQLQHSPLQRSDFLRISRMIDPNDMEFWQFYGLERVFAVPGNTTRLLLGLGLKEMAELVIRLDPLLRGDARQNYLAETEQALSDAIDVFCDVDLSDDPVYDAEKRVWTLAQRFTDQDGGLTEEVKKTIISILRRESAKRIARELMDTLRLLPGDFAHLWDTVRRRRIYIMGAEELLQQALGYRRYAGDANDYSVAWSPEEPDSAEIDYLFQH